MPAAVIFDLYNTLIYLPRDVNPYMRLFRSVDCTSRVRESMVVDAPTLTDFCEHLAVSPPGDIFQMQRELDADIASASTFPDTVPTLQALRRRGVLLAVISNLATPYKLPFFRLGLDALVNAVIFSCDIGVAKPDPEIYRAALAELNVDPNNALMVGDSQQSDVDGPMACGIRGFLLDRDGNSSGNSSLRALSEVESAVIS